MDQRWWQGFVEGTFRQTTFRRRGGAKDGPRGLDGCHLAEVRNIGVPSFGLALWPRHTGAVKQRICGGTAVRTDGFAVYAGSHNTHVGAFGRAGEGCMRTRCRVLTAAVGSASPALSQDALFSALKGHSIIVDYHEVGFTPRGPWEARWRDRVYISTQGRIDRLDLRPEVRTRHPCGPQLAAPVCAFRSASRFETGVLQMAKDPQDFAARIIESLAINVLAILLEKAVLSPDEAGKLIAGMKADLQAFTVGTAEAAHAKELLDRLDDLARRFALTKPN